MRLTTRASLRRPGGRNLQTQLRNRKGGLVAIARADGLPMSIAGIVSSGKRFHNGYIVNPQCHAPNLPPGTLFSWTDGREPGRADKRQAPSFLLDRLLGKRKKRPESRSLSTQLAEAVRFELTKGFPLPVFKTGAIDHSATLPRARSAALAAHWRGPDYSPLRDGRQSRSNSAIDSTCDVCGNMLAMPAPLSR